MADSMTQANSLASFDDGREMKTLWPSIVRDLTDSGCYRDIPDVMKWMAKVLQYNVLNSQMRRGIIVVYAYHMLARPEQLTDENLRLARILGWCIEINEAFVVVEDDIVDHSKTRRGHPCWYLHSNIGIAAVHDGIILEHAVYQLLKTHFKKEECYSDLLEILHDVLYCKIDIYHRKILGLFSNKEFMRSEATRNGTKQRRALSLTYLSNPES